MSEPSQFSRIDTVIVRVRNLEQARDWYQQRLGLDPVYFDANERLVVCGFGGATSLTIWELKPEEEPSFSSGNLGTYPIFFSEDIEAAHQDLAERGVKVGSIQEGNGGVRWFRFWDLEGNIFEVCHYLEG
jgi:catechol 2,3-dioxygenase-like lactoylglutathione lyase family enzyme